MQQVPAETWAAFERRLDRARVSAPQRPDYHKSGIVDFGGPRAAFRQIRGDGDCGSAHLVGEAKSVFRGEVTCQLTYDVGEGNRLVPSLKLFRVEHSAACLTPQLSTLNPHLLLRKCLAANEMR